MTTAKQRPQYNFFRSIDVPLTAHKAPPIDALIAYYFAIVTSVGMEGGLAPAGLLSPSNFD
jgi:hypothetical protein